MLTISPASAAVKQVKCKAGFVKVKSGLSYKCIKDKKPNQLPIKEVPVKEFSFKTMCEADPNVPSEWAEYQSFALNTFGCARPTKFVKKGLSSILPSTQLNETNRISADSCKIRHGVRQKGGQIAFTDFWDYKIDLSKEVNIQVIPIEFSDFPSNGTPEKDYGKYFKYIKDGYFNLSDGRVKINFSTPSSYFKLDTTAKSYSTGKTFSYGGIWQWVDMDLRRLFDDITVKVDNSIDFSNVTTNMFIFPPTTDDVYIAHRPSPDLNTAEKVIKSNYVFPPNSLGDRRSWYGVEPFLHLHELQHAWNKLDDHLGDLEDESKFPTDLGTGSWGIMSGMRTDFLFWDKWITNMVDDSQIICVDPKKDSTNWIKPSSYFGVFEKAIVIPVSTTKVIVVESIRSAGFNYKIPESQTGALVYVVDTTNTKGGYGINVLRTKEEMSGPLADELTGPRFFLWNAALRGNEYIIIDDYKISIAESGDFGDVVRVQLIK
jgi:hypothetical protein